MKVTLTVHMERVKSECKLMGECIVQVKYKGREKEREKIREKLIQIYRRERGREMGV